MTTDAQVWNDDQPSGLSRPTAQVDCSPEQLPEVRALLKAGWELAPEAPVWAFLPAVWPREHRTWVFDRSTRTLTETAEGISRSVAWDEAEYEDREVDYGRLCEQAGVSARPRARLWLLRTPHGMSLSDVLKRVIQEVEASGRSFRSSRHLAEVTRNVVERVWLKP